MSSPHRSWTRSRGYAPGEPQIRARLERAGDTSPLDRLIAAVRDGGRAGVSVPARHLLARLATRPGVPPSTPPTCQVHGEPLRWLRLLAQSRTRSRAKRWTSAAKTYQRQVDYQGPLTQQTGWALKPPDPTHHRLAHNPMTDVAPRPVTDQGTVLITQSE